MGMSLSSMGKGLPSTQTIGFVMGTLYKPFAGREIKNFAEFHSAILDVFNTINSALPGKHYDAPSREEVEVFFNDWKNALEAPEKKQLFVTFMENKMSFSKLDDFTMIAVMGAPPAAMAAKRAGEIVPQLKIIKAIPDIIFVPAATVLAIISARITRMAR